MRGIALIAIGFLMAGCQTAAPVDRPCGVIRDSLVGVQATTPAGQDRLNIHFVRGRTAGCWGRT